MLPPCRCGSSMTTSMPRLPGAHSASPREESASWVPGFGPLTLKSSLDSEQLVKFGGLINF